jgi:polyisoprenyl-teichoic acid--peptidoglycan teichoic acid transferase
VSHPVPTGFAAMEDRDTGDGGDGSWRGHLRADGDHVPAVNRQRLPEGVAYEVLTLMTSADPGRICHVAMELFPHLSADYALTAGEMVGLRWTLADIGSGDVDMFTLPVRGVGRARGQAVVWPEEQTIEAIGSTMSPDAMASYRTGQ